MLYLFFYVIIPLGDTMTNKEKNEQYMVLMSRLKRAIEGEFYYEAIFIEYAILEDRAESLLKHAKLPLYDEYDRPLNLNSKLNTIKHSSKFNMDDYVKKHITRDLISNIHNWKNRRNTLIHDLVESNYYDEQIMDIALDGYEIIKLLNSKSALVNKYFDKTY